MDKQTYFGKLSGARMDALTRIDAVLRDDHRNAAAKTIRIQEIMDQHVSTVAELNEQMRLI